MNAFFNALLSLPAGELAASLFVLSLQIVWAFWLFRIVLRQYSRTMAASWDDVVHRCGCEKFLSKLARGEPLSKKEEKDVRGGIARELRAIGFPERRKFLKVYREDRHFNLKRVATVWWSTHDKNTLTN